MIRKSVLKIKTCSRNEILLYILCALCFLIAGCSRKVEQKDPVRQNINKNWMFIRDADSSLAFSDSANWSIVNLPHTPKIEPLVVNDQWQGICWYKKVINLDRSDSGRKVFIKFEGAMNVAEIWVNREFKIRHLGGYLPFVIDITEEANFSQDNEIIVKLDNNDNPVTGPKPLDILDFNMYGGLYRDVYLIIKNQVYITDPTLEKKPAGGGIFVTYPHASKDLAVVEIKTHVRNDGIEEKEVKINQSLVYDKKYVTGSETIKLPVKSNGELEFQQRLNVANPKLWSPREPDLYQLITTIYSDNILMDADTCRIGIRRFNITKDHFSINGEEWFLRGVNRHQEYPYVGYALSNAAQYRDALKIKEAGFDYVRLSHYPHSPAFMAACDELGLVVLDAILGWQYYSDDKKFEKQIFKTCRDLIRRDRNHPCVMAWEVSLNESWMPEYFIDSLVAIAKAEYPGDQCFTAGWQKHGYDIYLQARQHRINHYIEPEKPYIVSEYGDWEYYALNAGLNQQSWENLKQEERSSRQLPGSGEKRLLQQVTNIQEAHNDNFNTTAFADGYWVMFDYNRGYAEDLEASGIMSITRLPKFSYYFFRSQRKADVHSELYSSGPMVFIASYWNENSETEVRIFSNCDEVELSLNDSLIGRQSPDNKINTEHLASPPFTFSIEKFIPGTLKATGIINKEPVASFSISTPGDPAYIKLRYDSTRKDPVPGVNDLIFVYAQICDKNGSIVPVNGIKIQFFISENGDLVSPSKIETEAGIASALIRIGESNLPVDVLAKNPKLQKDEISINISDTN